MGASGTRPAAVRTIMITVAVVVAIGIGAVVVAGIDRGDDDGGSSTLRVAAPTVAVGDIDLAVLSTSFDEDGARGPLGADVLDGARRRRCDRRGGGDATVRRRGPGGDAAVRAAHRVRARAVIAVSWEDGAPFQFSAGGPPAHSGEVVINQSLAARYGIGVGVDLSVRSGPDVGMPSSTGNARVVGVFSPAGGDVDGLNLVVLPADDLASVTGRASFDRVDIVGAPTVPIDELLDRVAAALPAGTMVVPPSVIGFDEQLRAELEIQRAYHWLLDPDLAHRRQASDVPTDGPGAEQNQKNWDDNLWQTVDTELRVSRVAFVDNGTARGHDRADYAGHPLTADPNPLTGVVQKIDGQWRIGNRGLCELARQAKLECASDDGIDASSLVGPPNGWNPARLRPRCGRPDPCARRSRCRRWEQCASRRSRTARRCVR